VRITVGNAFKTWLFEEATRWLIMSKTKHIPRLRRIKKWYDRVMFGPRPAKMELEMESRGYIDQAELLI
jgi:hypothetical protein